MRDLFLATRPHPLRPWLLVSAPRNSSVAVRSSLVAPSVMAAPAVPHAVALLSEGGAVTFLDLINGLPDDAPPAVGTATRSLADVVAVALSPRDFPSTADMGNDASILFLGVLPRSRLTGNAGELALFFAPARVADPARGQLFFLLRMACRREAVMSMGKQATCCSCPQRGGSSTRAVGSGPPSCRRRGRAQLAGHPFQVGVQALRLWPRARQRGR